MKGNIDHTTLARWRRHPIRFIEQVLCDPETGKPFVLLDAERSFLKEAFKFGPDGRLLYPELVYSAPKKSGKTTLAALFVLTIILLYGNAFAEGYCVANDLEQAQSRVFEIIRRIVECSPLLRREARITATKIVFAAFRNAQISALASDAASAAGGAPVVSAFDELWAFTSERSRRLWDEMVPVPTRKISCRLVVSYAGYEGESELLLDLYKRGLAQPEIAPNLHAGDGILMFWTHAPVASWQDERWLADMRRSLRVNQYLRMIENRFVTSESVFVPMAEWDRRVEPHIGHTLSNRSLPIFVGVDASHKHDASAVVAVTFDRAAQLVRLVDHRIFQPTPQKPLDFAATVEAYLLDLKRGFSIRKILFDPWQMQAVAQRLMRAGLPIEEFPQSQPNLTAASQNLYELITDGGIVLYPDPAMRLAASRAIAVETSRGWRISKEKQSHKIDVVIALAMAAYAAVQSSDEHYYDSTFRWVDGPDLDAPADEDINAEWRRQRNVAYVMSGGTFILP